jgi:hypothetical protein
MSYMGQIATCQVCEAVLEKMDILRAELAAANEKISDWENAAKFVHDEKCSGDQIHCACVPILRGEVAILKKELAAAQAENERLRDALIIAHMEICSAHYSDDFSPMGARLQRVEHTLGWDGRTYAHDRKFASEDVRKDGEG